jgi:hypothetical protein
MRTDSASARPRVSVEQVAARLDFAGAPQIRGVDHERREWIRAGDDRMVRENCTELEREGVERLLEFVRGDEERRREPRLVPRVDADRARAQIAGRHRFDDRQRVRRRRVVAVSGMRRVRAFTLMPDGLRALAIDDERLQPAAENLAEFALQRLYCVGDHHTHIVAVSSQLSAFRLRAGRDTPRRSVFRLRAES